MARGVTVKFGERRRKCVERWSLASLTSVAPTSVKICSANANWQERSVNYAWGVSLYGVRALARCGWGWDMITSSITAQCYPLRIIHSVMYTLNRDSFVPLSAVPESEISRLLSMPVRLNFGSEFWWEYMYTMCIILTNALGFWFLNLVFEIRGRKL